MSDLRLGGVHIAAALGATAAMLLAPPVQAQDKPSSEEPAWEGVSDGEPGEPGSLTDADAQGDLPAEGGETSSEEDGAWAVSSEDASDQVVVESGGGLFESSQDAEPSEGASIPNVELGGYVRGDTFVGLLPGTTDPGIQAAYAELSLQLRARAGAHGDAFAEARFRYGQQLSERDLFLELREAYVNAYLGPVDLRFGQQIVVWGRADAFNPTNNITPVDFRIRSPIEDDRRLGNVGARAFVNFLPFRLEGVWMPLYLPTTYPDIPLNDLVVFTEPTFPPNSLQRGLWATRLHLETAGFDASVSYLYGEALLPGFAVSGYDVGEDAEIRVARTSYTHHVVGADFSTTVGELFGLRGEAAYRRPVDFLANHAPNPDLQYVIGIDKEFGSLGIIAQYLGRYTFDWQEAPPPENGDPAMLQQQTPPLAPIVEQAIEDALAQTIANRNQMLFNQLAELQHMVSLRLEWTTLHDTLTFSALGLANVTTEEWLLFPKITYKIADGMSAALGAEVYAGPEGTLLGTIQESLTAGYGELRMSF